MTQAGRHVTGDRERRKAPRGSDRRAWGRRPRHGRLLRRASKAPLARHLADCVGQAHGAGGGGVSAGVPELRQRYSAQKRRPAGAGPLRTGGSQAGEGQDGFARVKSDPHTPRRATRASAHLSRPWSADRLGRARAGPRPGNLSGVARRAPRHRHPQPLTAFHATVRTARKKSGFKTGLRRRHKSGLGRG